MDNGQTNNQGVNPFMPTGPEGDFQDNFVKSEEVSENQETQDVSISPDNQEIGKTAIGALTEPREETNTNFGEVTPVMPPGYNVEIQTNEQPATETTSQEIAKPTIHSPEKLGAKLEEEAGTNPAEFYEELLGARGEVSEKGAKNDQ